MNERKKESKQRIKKEKKGVENLLLTGTMEGKGWKGMVGMKLKLGFWIGEENSVSVGTFPPMLDITWQSPYILAESLFSPKYIILYMECVYYI